jgi:hypothetical protein
VRQMPGERPARLCSVGKRHHRPRSLANG